MFPLFLKAYVWCFFFDVFPYAGMTTRFNKAMQSSSKRKVRRPNLEAVFRVRGIV